MPERAFFGASRAGLALSAALVTGVAYVAALSLDAGGIFERYPFGIALVVGLAFLAYRTLGQGPEGGLVVDAEGIEDVGSGARIPWRAVEEVRIDEAAASAQVGLRVATVSGGGAQVQFTDQVGVRLASALATDNAGALLGVVAAQTKSEALYPPTWRASPNAAPDAPDEPPSEARRTGVGLIGLLVKAGPKAGSMALKLLKTIKPGAAIVAVGAYSLLVSWKFALAIVLHVLVHECGHVFAMFRSGVAVKGIYLVPFFGGAAVSRGVAKTRAKSAYIAINGPIWGLVLCALFGAAHIATTGAYPLLGALAGWGALINLFNLLPILPLDGGRILTCLALSTPSRRGVVAVFGSLALGAFVAYLAELELLVLMVFLGLFELVSYLGARPLTAATALMPPVTSAELAHFSRLLLSPRNADRDKLVAQRQAMYERRLAEARQTPMDRRQVAITLVGYVAVAAALVGLLYATTGIEGAGDPMQLLR